MQEAVKKWGELSADEETSKLLALAILLKEKGLHRV